MTLPTLSPPSPPSREDGSARASTNSRDLMATFGDGYEQRGMDGLNNLSRTVALVWAFLAATDADTFCTTLDSYGRSQAFYYTLPWEGSARKVAHRRRCK